MIRRADNFNFYAEQALYSLLLLSVEKSCGQLGNERRFVQENQGKTAYFLGLGATIYCGGNMNYQEAGAFLKMQGCDVVCPFSVKDGFTPIFGRGKVLHLKKYISNPATYEESQTPHGIKDYQQIHQLYLDCGFSVPSFDEYYVNLFSRLQCGEMEFVVLRRDARIVAVAGRSGRIITGVSVLPQFQKNKLGRAVVCAMADEICKKGQVPLVLFRDEASGFYEKLPFAEEEILWIFEI